MAFMFSRAAWADLKGKNAARLTMLLNFAMLSTLSSTWNADTPSPPKPHQWAENTQHREEKSPARTHLREQHADLLHLFDGEQRVAGRMLEQHVQQHLQEVNSDLTASEAIADKGQRMVF